MSLNFAPAMGAASKTAMDAITGVSGPLGGGDLDELVDEYRRERDKLKHSFTKAAAAHPAIALAGNVAGAIPTLGLAGPAGARPLGIGATGAIAGTGDAVSSGDDLATTVNKAGTGAVTAMGTAGLMHAGGAALGAAGRKLGTVATDLAEKATGATGKQAGEFVPGTGRALLDRKIVGFGDSPGDIAAKANSALDAAESSKADIVQNQLPGVNVDRNTVYNYLRNKIQSLSGNESQLWLARKLEGKLEDITGVAEQNGSEVPLAKSEEIRRGFDKSAKWNSTSDAADLEANKITANAYREAGEDAATAANPELGAQFKADKSTQHMLIPVAEAAEKRALQLQQSPHGGLLSASHAGVGGMIGGAVGGPVGAVVGAGVGLANKALRSRYASMGAVTADKLSQVLTSSPQAMGKFAPVLQKAAARGSVSLGATDYILQQTNPEYRAHKERVFSSPQDEEEGGLP